MTNKGLTFKFEYSNSQLMLLSCKTKSNKEFLALIDTGSEVTIFDESLKEDMYIIDDSSNDIILHSMHGEDDGTKYVGAIKVKMTDVEGTERPALFEGILSDIAHISAFLKETYDIKQDVLVVIGSDTLNREGVVIDCELGQITF